MELLIQSSDESLYPYPTVLILPKSLLESHVNLPTEKINFPKIQERKITFTKRDSFNLKVYEKTAEKYNKKHRISFSIL